MLEFYQAKKLAEKVVEKLNQHVASRGGDGDCFATVICATYECSVNISFQGNDIFIFNLFEPAYTEKTLEQQILDEIKLELHKLQTNINLALTI